MISILKSQRGMRECSGKMQEHYTHGVPPSKRNEVVGGSRRIAVVFRDGDIRQYKKDSGRPCTNLEPRVLTKEPIFGHICHLQEGSIYTRRQLLELRAHRGQQRGVSGKKDSGCDAIIISGKLPGKDNFKNFYYTADRLRGGLALEFSGLKNLPIRVFRSTSYPSKYRAVFPEGSQKGSMATSYYRYDGLYTIWSFTGSGEGQRTFHLVHGHRHRQEKGTYPILKAESPGLQQRNNPLEKSMGLYLDVNEEQGGDGRRRTEKRKELLATEDECLSRVVDATNQIKGERGMEFISNRPSVSCVSDCIL